MKIIHDFTTPEYAHALATSIKAGLVIVVGMLVVGAVLTLAGGGWSATWWKSKENQAHH